MKTRHIVETEDGSHTIFIPELKEHYHSSHGAIQESMHIYIENGLKKIDKSFISVLEIGFGTGLNCLLIFLEAKKMGKWVSYRAIDKYPLSNEEIEKINYGKILDAQDLFDRIHKNKWNQFDFSNKDFDLMKTEIDLKNFKSRDKFDLIIFDAFGPDVQPDLWTVEIFTKLYKQLYANGILMTYSSKGIVKQALRDAGFFVQRLPGPKGKRHIISASKKMMGEPLPEIEEDEIHSTTRKES